MKAKEFVTETINPDCFNPAFNDTQHFDGLTYRATVEEEYGKPVLTVKVLDDNFQQAGLAKFKPSKAGVVSLITSFRPEYQGQGLARNIYAYVRALGNTIVPSRNQLPAGRAMWDAWKKSGDAKHLMRDVAEGILGSDPNRGQKVPGWAKGGIVGKIGRKLDPAWSDVQMTVPQHLLSKQSSVPATNSPATKDMPKSASITPTRAIPQSAGTKLPQPATKNVVKTIADKQGVAEGSSYNIDQDDHDEFTPDEIVRIKNSHFPDKLRDNLRAAKKEARRAKHFSSSSDGGDSKLGSPVGSASDNTYEGVAEGLSEMDNRTPSGDRREQRANSPEAKAKQDKERQNRLKNTSPEMRKKLRLPEPKQGVAEGEVVQFPKKHPYELLTKCPECGGPLQGGKDEKGRLKLCMPCMNIYRAPNQQGVAEGLPGSLSKSDYTLGATVKNPNTSCKRCNGRGTLWKAPDGKILPANDVPGAKKYKCGACDGIGMSKKEVDEGKLDELAIGGSGDSGDYLKTLASAWYTMDFELLAHIARQGGNPLKNRMDVQETIENMLDRGIHCPDGKVRKYYIGYSAAFDGVEITSHDHYEHSDTDDAGNDIDDRTGKPWGPYDVVEFSGDDLDESVLEGENWSKHNNKRAGGMSKKSVSVYRREHPGSKIQTAVTTKPSKLKKGSKAAKRRASFCARMRGMKKHRTGAKTAHDPNSNINKSLRRWHCESIEELHELVMLAEQYIRNNKK